MSSVASAVRQLLLANTAYDYSISPERVACLGEIFRQSTYSFQRFVEQLSFVPNGGQEWCRTLQLEVPSGAKAQRKPAWWIVPLGQFDRRRLADVLVEDATGRRLNLLTRSQHGEALSNLVTITYVLSLLPSEGFTSNTTRRLTGDFQSLLFKFFTGNGHPSDEGAGLVDTFLTLQDDYARLVATLGLSSSRRDQLTEAFRDDLESWIARTQYLCWLQATPGEVVNLQVSYTASDPKHELEIGSVQQAFRSIRIGLPGKRSERARQQRANWYRQYGLAPIDYEFKAPPDPRPGSYYMTIDPPPYTSLTYLDWDDGHHFNETHSEDEELEVTCAKPAAHIHSDESSAKDAGSIRAYLRCAPYRHKQILGATALNFAVVWLLAKGSLPLNLTEPLQGFVVAVPTIVIGFLAQQQRHYYSQVMRRQRALLWFYLLSSVLFLVSAAFSQRDHIGGLLSYASVSGWILAIFSAGVFGWHLLLGGSYERAVRYFAKRHKGKQEDTPMWQCYGDAVSRYAVVICLLSVILMALAAGSLYMWWGDASSGSVANAESRSGGVRIQLNGIQVIQAGGGETGAPKTEQQPVDVGKAKSP